MEFTLPGLHLVLLTKKQALIGVHSFSAPLVPSLKLTVKGNLKLTLHLYNPSCYDRFLSSILPKLLSFHGCIFLSYEVLFTHACTHTKQTKQAKLRYPLLRS